MTRRDASKNFRIGAHPGPASHELSEARLNVPLGVDDPVEGVAFKRGALPFGQRPTAALQSR